MIREIDIYKLQTIAAEKCMQYAPPDPPCEGCEERKFFARAFDLHIRGEDCPYKCEKWEEWKDGNSNNL